MKSSLLIGTAALLAINAHAQTWTVTNLHPAGATGSRLSDTNGAQQVGSITTGGKTHAGLWSSTAASFVDLHPALATDSFAQGIGSSQQVGDATVDGKQIPVAWTGTANSLQSFLPNGISSGSLTSTAEGQQGGLILFPEETAIIWMGSAENLVNLHPNLVATRSAVRSTNGSRQVGYAVVGGAFHAAAWSGTKASFVDLHPVGAGVSIIHNVERTQKPDAQMVGVAAFGGATHAALWTGTAASFVDLNPPGSEYSYAYGTDGVHQVGAVKYVTGLRAALWTSTVASFVNLHALLPGEFSESEATAVWTDGTTTLVAGWATNTTTNRGEAMLWKLAPEDDDTPGSPELILRGNRVRETSARQLVIRGTATNADRVEVKVGRAGYRTVGGTVTWSHRVKLESGKNRARFRAVNSVGEASRVLTVIVNRK